MDRIIGAAVFWNYVSRVNSSGRLAHVRQLPIQTNAVRLGSSFRQHSISCLPMVHVNGHIKFDKLTDSKLKPSWAAAEDPMPL